jgi:hypothetical protein
MCVIMQYTAFYVPYVPLYAESKNLFKKKSTTFGKVRKNNTLHVLPILISHITPILLLINLFSKLSPNINDTDFCGTTISLGQFRHGLLHVQHDPNITLQCY